ncbi:MULTISPECIES: HNH endonuclease signature motif containing protein [unclassified Leucobacter]|uniref:HNH endonuclease signature motif containing protein n=1 Tax=unclassified Leucobacter TaxID=2621730 RepID=UPI00165E4EAE|nr:MULTISPECIES: HNH endonuclease signature motif containing protein [unclassified Leucobacter]MBC9926470.1 DUF222 domain-containing protein [Leucobacter sp. cx-169]
MALTASGVDDDTPEIVSQALLIRAAAALSEAVGDRLGLKTDREIVALTQQVEALGRQVDALRVELAGEVDHRARNDFGSGSLAFRHGCHNATELLRRLALVSAGTATKRFALARVTRAQLGFSGSTVPPKFPAVAAALASHAICIESAEIITRGLGVLPGHVSAEDVSHAEQCLVAAACGTTPPGGQAAVSAAHADDIRTMCRPWVAVLDQDGPEPRFDQQQMHRFISFGHEKNGLVPIRGAVAPEVAALVGRMFDAINSPRTREAGGPTATDSGVTATATAIATAESALTTPPSIAGTPALSGGSSVRFVPVDPSDDSDGDADDFAPADRRTPGQRRHDAFAAIAQAASQQDSIPTLGGAAVTVLIQVEEEQLTAKHGFGWLHGHDGEVTPISIDGVAHASCAGSVHRVVQNSDGRVIELGNSQRIFTAHQRRVIAMRDGGCIIPGCSVPASWCEVHHVTEHAKGGSTHTDNGATLCWYHHRSLRSNGWEVRMRDGLPEVLAPPWIDSGRGWRSVRPPTRPPGLDALRRRRTG